MESGSSFSHCLGWRKQDEEALGDSCPFIDQTFNGKKEADQLTLYTHWL